MKTNLNIETFIKGMEYLNAYYVHLKIDLDSKLVKQVWLDTFKQFTDAEFTTLIKNYCINNTYPPTSPTSLIQEYEKKLLTNTIEPETAFNNVMEVRARSEVSVLTISGHVKNIKKIKETLVDEFNDQTSAKVVEMLKHEFMYPINDDERTWIKKSFIDLYNRESGKEIKQKLITNITLLGNNNE